MKGFKRVTLAPGEKRTVSIPIKATSLASWNDTTQQLEVQHGDVELLIGSSSSEILGKKALHIAP